MSHFKVLLPNHDVKGVSVMVVTMDLDREPIPLDSRLWYFILFLLLILCHAL